MKNDVRINWILESALQIARLKAHGATLESDGLLLRHSGYEVQDQIKYYQTKLESDALSLLLVQNIKYEGD